MYKEIYFLLTLAERVNRIAKHLGDEAPCYWYQKDGKRYLVMYDGESTHDIPESINLDNLGILKERKG